MQPDFLHLRELVARLDEVFRTLPHPVDDLLDVWCGSRPYDDLFPPGARRVGLDVPGNPYGVADVVSSELVTCIQAFQYMPDPAHAAGEFARVLRPGGTAVVTLVFGYEYDRENAFEGRYTEHQLRALFEAWDDVRVLQDGGRTVTWAVLTGSLLHGLQQRAGDGVRGRLARPLFGVTSAGPNGLGLALSRLDSRSDVAAFPMNLTLVARAPR
jgi:hypothetical protein